MTAPSDHASLDATLRKLLPLDAGPGPALPCDTQQADTLIEGALAAWGQAGAQSPAASAPEIDRQTPVSHQMPVSHQTPGPRRAPVWTWAVAAAALLVVLAGGAAAATYLWRSLPEPAPADPERAPARKASPMAAPPAEMAPKPETAEPETAEPETAEPETAEPEAAAAPERPGRPAPVQPRTPRQEAQDLLARANGLRGQGEWQRAEATYREVFGRYPRTSSAYVARVAAAALRLEQLDDPRGARKLWEAARTQRPGGSLDMEVHLGLAEAARQLGDPAAEAEALEVLVERYAHTPAADQARRRLDVLARSYSNSSRQ